MRLPATTMRPAQGWGLPSSTKLNMPLADSGTSRSGSTGESGGTAQARASFSVQRDVFGPDGHDPDTGHCQPEAPPFLLAWSQVTIPGEAKV